MAFITNAEGAYFFQTRLDEVFEWLTCTGVGDVTFPASDRTPVYCPDPLNSGKFVIEGFIEGDLGMGTYRLTKPLVNVYNFILEALCPHYGRINWVCRGNRQDHRNYELACLLVDANHTARGISAPVREPEGSTARVNTTMDLAYVTAMMVYNLTVERQTVINTADAHGVFFLPARCEDRCGSARDLCQEGIIGLERAQGYLYDAEIKKTHDSGATWGATPVDPYAYGGDTHAVLMFETVTAVRLLVFRAARVAGHPAECAFSEDWGTTWTNIAISAQNNVGVLAAAVRGAAVYAAGHDGYIWRSINQGGLWTESEAGVEAPGVNLNGICFHTTGRGYAVGNAGTFLTLGENSENWATGTSPVAAPINILSVATNLLGHVFVGTNDGRVFRSADGGATWVEWVDHGVGTIPWIAFEQAARYVGAYIHNSAAALGALYRSEDGGASWWEVPNMPTNNGLNSGFMCDQNNIVVVGNQIVQGTTFIAKTTPI